MKMLMLSLFASCPKGLESLLAKELKELGVDEVIETIAGVSFSGNLEMAYKACLWSRVASRVLLRIGEIDVANKRTLYSEVQAYDWAQHLSQRTSFRVDFNGSTPDIKHTRFGAQVVKDAITDQFRTRYGWCPLVNLSEPDLRINVHSKGDKAFVAIDLSGQSLHERGYRLDSGEAPLKENLAAGILYRSGWPELAQEGRTLVDLMCGSGTLLIEAAMMAADIAPGLLKCRFGFNHWMGHIPKIWLKVLEEAKQRRKEGLAEVKATILGYDGQPEMVKRTRANIDRIDLGTIISVTQQELSKLTVGRDMKSGLVIANPPYGIRMGDASRLDDLYKQLGEQIKQQMPGWQAAIFTSSPSLVRNLGMGYKKRYTLFNGALSCKLYLYDVRERSVNESTISKSSEYRDSHTSSVITSPCGEMFANRLQKNLKRLGKWAKKERIDSYRLYDADMPEYAVAIDLYRDWAHVQEYAPPKSVDGFKANKRLQEVLQVIPRVLGIPESHVVIKRRQRQSGRQQYGKMNSCGDMLEVSEGNCHLLVNLKDYIDTGLFLDHRKIRAKIAKEAAGKAFLNLFCYTGTATVLAAKSGATSTTSVDLSNTYLGWARKNLALNGLLNRKNRLIKADCMQWLRNDNLYYDLIFVDPPTFSNSKRLKDVFDLQKSHSELITLVVNRLKPGGQVYFSSNFRSFKFAQDLEQKFNVVEITASTIDQDFKRRSKIHRCWRIEH